MCTCITDCFEADENEDYTTKRACTWRNCFLGEPGSGDLDNFDTSPGCHKCLVLDESCPPFTQSMFCYIDPLSTTGAPGEEKEECHIEECKSANYVALPGLGYTKGPCEGCIDVFMEACGAICQAWGSSAHCTLLCQCIFQCEKGGSNIATCLLTCTTSLFLS